MQVGKVCDGVVIVVQVRDFRVFFILGLGVEFVELGCFFFIFIFSIWFDLLVGGYVFFILFFCFWLYFVWVQYLVVSRSFFQVLEGVLEIMGKCGGFEVVFFCNCGYGKSLYYFLVFVVFYGVWGYVCFGQVVLFGFF